MLWKSTLTPPPQICGGTFGPGPTKHHHYQCKKGEMISYSHIANGFSVFQLANDQMKTVRTWRHDIVVGTSCPPNHPIHPSLWSFSGRSFCIPLWVLGGGCPLGGSGGPSSHIRIPVLFIAVLSVLTSRTASLLGQASLVIENFKLTGNIWANKNR